MIKVAIYRIKLMTYLNKNERNWNLNYKGTWIR